MGNETIDEMGSLELPWLDVNTLAEFERCENAGVIAFQRQGFENDRDLDRIPNLGYVPNFDYAKLLEAADKLLDSLLRLTMFLLVILTIIALVRISGRLTFSLLLLSATFPVLFVFIRDSRQYLEVRQQIRKYDQARPSPLPVNALEPVQIHWWELVKCGFEPRLTGRYSDAERRFGGRPWRLLVNSHDREIIPVVRHHEIFENKLSVTDVYKSNLVFNSLLIDHHENTAIEPLANSVIKWGLILDSKSLAGIAIPITQADRERAYKRLRELQIRIRSSAKRRKFQNPPLNACLYCPLGSPRLPGIPTKLGNELVEPRLYDSIDSLTRVRDEADEDNYDYSYEVEIDKRIRRSLTFEEWRRRPAQRHCDCGDVFQWTPNHQFWLDRENKDRERYKK